MVYYPSPYMIAKPVQKKEPNEKKVIMTKPEGFRHVDGVGYVRKALEL
jgi:hypothetical protein